MKWKLLLMCLAATSVSAQGMDEINAGIRARAQADRGKEPVVFKAVTNGTTDVSPKAAQAQANRTIAQAKKRERDEEGEIQSQASARRSQALSAQARAATDKSVALFNCIVKKKAVIGATWQDTGGHC